MSKTTPPIRIVLADDHEIFRDGFKVMLRKHQAIKLVAEAANGEELIEITRKHNPDVVVTDIKMPKLDGIAASKLLLNEFPLLNIIALSMFDDDRLIVEMLEAGVKGYLLKNAKKEEIITAIETVYNGKKYHCATTSFKLAELIAKSKYNPHRKQTLPELSEKDKQVIRLICQQKSNKEIADVMNLSIRTIEGYRDRIQEKLDVKNIAGIVIYAIRHKIYEP